MSEVEQDHRIHAERFGWDPDEWLDDLRRCRQALERVAKMPEVFLTYKELAQEMHRLGSKHDLLGRMNGFDWLIREVATAGYADKGVILSALVVGRESHRPGPGYFALAKHLRRSEKKTWDTDWMIEVRAVNAAYRRRPVRGSGEIRQPHGPITTREGRRHAETSAWKSSDSFGQTEHERKS